jgi:NAD(P)-dependent dehydrogenase (short-subunit alcohol dehydrogenase family)
MGTVTQANTGQTMQGRVCLVTGATNGIGRATAQALAERGATVLLAGRNAARVQATVNAIRQKSGNPTVEGLTADLSAVAEVRRLAEEVQARWPRLHVLVNNAGAIFATRQESVDGIEMTWALNHLSYFLLTGLLLEALKAGGQPGRSARIVNVASGAHRRARLNFDDLESRRGYFSYGAYGQSKLANILFTRELARRLAGSEVTANAMHPGLVHTGFGGNNRQWIWRLVYFCLNRMAQTPEQGAETAVFLAASRQVEGVTGQYFVACKPAATSAAAQDETAARRLWAESERTVKQEMRRATT